MYLLTREGGWCQGSFAVQHDKVSEWKVDARNVSFMATPEQYFVEGLPVEYHCHGIGRFDFSEFDTAQLYEIDAYLRKVGVYCVLTGFLPIDNIGRFEDFIFSFNQEKRAGLLPNILGVSLEGPLLSSVGGTPQKGTWAPSRRQWEQLVRYAGDYLPYIVLSPDALLEGGCFHDTVSQPGYPTLEWVIELLLEHNIRPSLGHFQKTNPVISLRSVNTVLDIVERKGTRLRGAPVITDHLFNDMPLSFKHAWRTPEDRITREQDLIGLDLDSLSIYNVDEKLGVVPGAIIKAAKNGLIVPSINFDGDHVDIAVSRHMVNFIGSGSIIAMTDNASLTRQLCGRILSKKNFNSLLYQEDDIVAAGTQNIIKQIDKLRVAGISDRQIWDMVSFVPHKMAIQQSEYHSDADEVQRYSYVSNHQYSHFSVAVKQSFFDHSGL